LLIKTIFVHQQKKGKIANAEEFNFLQFYNVAAFMRAPMELRKRHVLLAQYCA